MSGLTNKQMGKKTLLFTTIGKLNEETYKNSTDAFEYMWV